MKNLLKLFLLLFVLNATAQRTDKSIQALYGATFQNATEVTTATKIPVFDTNLKLNTWINPDVFTSVLNTSSINMLKTNSNISANLNVSAIQGDNVAVTIENDGLKVIVTQSIEVQDELSASIGDIESFIKINTENLEFTNLSKTLDFSEYIKILIDALAPNVKEEEYRSYGSGVTDINSIVFDKNIVTVYNFNGTNDSYFFLNQNATAIPYVYNLYDNIRNSEKCSVFVKFSDYMVLERTNDVSRSGYISFKILDYNGGLQKTSDGVWEDYINSFIINPIDTGGLGGTGTTNYLTKFTATETVGNSQIFDNGTNVGIGSTSPGGKLTVKQNAINGNTAAFTGTHIKLRGDTVADNSGFIGIAAATSVADNFGYTFGAQRTSAGQGAFKINFHNNSATGVNRLIIDQYGKVGIGITTPTEKLEVIGNIEASSGFILTDTQNTNRYKITVVNGVLTTTLMP